MNYTGYIPSVLMLPTFKPTAHSSTLFLDNYSAPIYAAASISPIFEVFSNIFIHSTFSYFQPYKRLINQGEGKFVYSDPFPMGSFLGNLALVWQSPVGPISISCAYYNKSETKWYPQFNIGYLLFRNRAKQN
jgi:NTE family protein